ncbi:MAG: SRPBCC family protein [Thaumarchaeota archaeon]|nr:SRPBCC family protein [Nitrososphaerota archaeon]
MAHAQKVIEIRAGPTEVFAHMDDIRNVGWHMEGKRSMPMMGGKLRLERLSESPTGVGATYRWYGSVMGMKVDFTEVVTKYVGNREKIWRTIGDPKIIIMSSYEMRLKLNLTDSGTQVVFEIDYELPHTWYGKIFGKLLAGWYAEWCLRRACEDTKQILESAGAKPVCTDSRETIPSSLTHRA